MEKKVLIPTNFTKHAWNALMYALSLYRSEACTFYLFHSYNPRNVLGDNISLVKDNDNSAEERSEQGLDKLLKGLSFRKENPGHQFITISHKGSLTEGIQDAIDAHGIDLILMGTIGESAPINLAYDNSVSRVIEKIENCPVLVIPEKIQLSGNMKREIVLPTNFRNGFKLKELSCLIDISKFLNAGIRLLYIDTDNKGMSEKQEVNKENLSTLLEGADFSFHKLTKTNITTGVHLFIESRESDMLALYKRRKGFFQKLFSHRLVEEVEFNAPVPVLVLKEMA